MKEFELGPRGLIVLRQQDNLPVRMTDGFVVGPLGSVDWPELESIATKIISALVPILELSDGAFMMEEFFGVTPPISPVGLVIAGTPGEAGDAALGRAETAAPAAGGSSGGKGERGARPVL